MKSLHTALLATAALTLFAAVASAEGERGPRGPQDLDQDGQISRAEFDQWADEMFTKLDANGDQVISEDEKPKRGPRGRMGRRGNPEAMAGRVFVKVADDNADGVLENGEFQVFLAGLETDADGALTETALETLLPPRPDREGFDGEAPEGLRTRIAGRLFDTDDDGAVTVDELNGIFTNLDANADGALTDDELPSFRRRGHRGHGSDRPGAGAGRFGS